jgi:hypothetical protein
VASALIDEAKRQYLSKNYAKALGLLDEARKLDPTNPATYKFQGLLYSQQGNPEKACTAYRRFLKLAPTDSGAAGARKYMEAQDPSAFPTCEVGKGAAKPAIDPCPPSDPLCGAEAPKGSAPTSLTAVQIAAVMRKADVGSCKAIGTGKVPVKVTIGSSGSVTSASSNGTPLGSCLEGVVRRLKFPAISGPSQTFSYPIFVKE